MKKLFNTTPDNHIQHCFDLRRENVLLKKSEWMGIRIEIDSQSDERLVRINKVRKCINVAAEVAYIAIICCVLLCIVNRIFPYEGLLASIITFIFCSIAGFLIVGMMFFFFQVVMDKMEDPILMEIFKNSDVFKRAQSYGFDVKRNKDICTPFMCGVKRSEIKQSLEKEFPGISVSAY